MSPTQRSLQKLREEGYVCQIVERWNPYARIRQDLFGFADLIAFRGASVVLVQTTVGCNVSKRLAKIHQNPIAPKWLADPHRSIHVHGWAKRGPRGERKTWQCRTEIVTPENTQE